MKYIIWIILTTSMLSVNGQVNIYDSIFDHGKLLKDGRKIKEVLSTFLSDDGNQIVASHIDTVILIKPRVLKNYGNAQLITVTMNKTAPKVLFPKFLIIANRATKKLNSLNLDNYYFIKTSSLGKDQIAGINNFRGNLQLSIYGFSGGQFRQIFEKTIYSGTDCNQYKFGTLKMENKDLNSDGCLDLQINYRINCFCDSEGAESEIPLYETKQSKKLYYSLKGKRAHWILK